jgi:hypothetical protein
MLGPVTEVAALVAVVVDVTALDVVRTVIEG